MHHSQKEIPPQTQKRHSVATDAWCVIPVYNNAGTAPRVARACRAHIEHVLVVDDGSTDADLRDLLRGQDITVLRHTRNQGKGRALMTALAHVAAQGGTHMITLDGDDQHLPEDLPGVLAAIRETPEALLVGCRDFNTPNVPNGSRFGRRFSNFWVRLETGRALHDTQSGFRVYPVEIARQLPLRGSYYDFEIEILVRALWAGVSVRDIPVQVRYPPPDERISHFRPWLDNMRMSRMHARLIARRLLPWPHAKVTQPAADDDKQPLSLLRQPVASLKRLLRENATPGGLAAAAAVGSLLAVLPLIWSHTVVILFASARLHLNKVMALAIQNLYIPPFTPFLCIQVGYYIRHGRFWTDYSRETLLQNIHHRLFEWLLGSLVLAPLYAIIAGVTTYFLARAIQRRMQRRRA